MYRTGVSQFPADARPSGSGRSTAHALKAAGWQEVSEGVNDVWDAVAAADKAATFFHTRHWAELVASAFPEKSIATRAFRRADGVHAVIPALRSTRVGGLLTVVDSAPPGVYGGPISDTSTDPGALGVLCALLKPQGLSRVLVTGNPFGHWQLPAEFEVSENSTQVVALTQSFETIQERFASRCRRAIQKAERASLTVRLGTTAEDYHAYYAVYLESLDRWGDRATSRYSERVFQAISRLEAERARLWLVEYKGEILGGIVMFYHNKHSVYWHGSYRRKAFDFGASNFLLWEAMKDAKARGFEVFDFNPSGGHEGVVHFKESFGPTTLPFTSGVARSTALRLANRLRRR